MTLSSPAPSLQRDLLLLLREERPREAAPEGLKAALGRFECGGYLHDRWTRAGRLAELPPAWSAALAAAHRKTAVDNLAALSELTSALPFLLAERVPFLLLKGGAYLVDLYDDPACRTLTDIDLLIRPADVSRLARRLAREGYAGERAGYEERFRRFEMWRPGPGEVRLEFHWWLGLPRRFRFPQEELWTRAVPCTLEGRSMRRLSPEDALLYHVAHQADHYFGPSLKWLLDLREMLRRWPLDHSLLLARADRFGARTALRLALDHLERLLPGETPEGLRAAAGALGGTRRFLIRPYLSGQPLELFDVPPHGRPRRQLLRLLFVDRLRDIAAVAIEGALRPLTLVLDRLRGLDQPPWARVK